MGIKGLQKIQLGDESTPGTPVAATAIWRGLGQIEDTRAVTMVEERVGVAMPTTRNYIAMLQGGLSMESTPATFEQLPYILEAGISTETPTQDGAGSDYIYNYVVGTTSANTLRTYTLETGDDTQAVEMAYSFVESFALTGEANEAVMMEANWIGRTVTDTTFTGAISVPTVEEILAGQGSFYVDDGGGTIGSSQFTASLLSWSLDVTTGWQPKFTVDDGQLYFNYAYFDVDSFSATLSGVYEHDSNGLAEIDAFQAGTVRLFRISIDGSAVASAGTTYSNKTLIIDCAGVYTSFSALTDQNGNSTVEFEAQIGYSPTDSLGLDITVVNELTALP